MNQNLLKTVKKMQEEMVAAQQEIESTTFYASAGGVVNVEVKGTKELVKVNIEEGFQADRVSSRFGGRFGDFGGNDRRRVQSGLSRNR